MAAIIDFLLSTMPKIVKGLAAIGAGFLAMKLTATAGAIIKTASAMIKAATSAKTAGTAIQGMSAAMNTTPWGLAATAIGLLTSAFVALGPSIEGAGADGVEALKKVRESVEDLNNTYITTTTEIETTATIAQKYADRLRELEAAGLKTQQQQQEYADIVAQLNDLYPNLNLSIDENTGLLEQNTESINELLCTHQ